MVPSIISSSACCTPSPDMSRVIDDRVIEQQKNKGRRRLIVTT
jgi:hypothetical protein